MESGLADHIWSAEEFCNLLIFENESPACDLYRKHFGLLRANSQKGPILCLCDLGRQAADFASYLIENNAQEFVLDDKAVLL